VGWVTGSRCNEDACDCLYTSLLHCSEAGGHSANRTNTYGRAKHSVYYILEETFRCDIPVVFYELNTKYITLVETQQNCIALCCTICNTTTCFDPFLGHLQVVYASLESDVP